MSEVPEDTFELVPVPLCQSFGGYRQAVDHKVYVRSGGVGNISQVSKCLLILFRLGVFRKRLVVVCGAV